MTRALIFFAVFLLAVGLYGAASTKVGGSGGTKVGGSGATKVVPPAGGGGIAFVSSVKGRYTSASSGLTTGTVSTVGATLIVVSLSRYTSGASVTLSDNQVNTWTALTESNNGSDIGERLYYCANPTTNASHTFSVSGATAFASIVVAAFSGVSASPFDVENGAFSNAATSLAAGSVTPTNNDSLLIAGLGTWATNTPTIDLSFTIADSQILVSGENLSVALAYLILPTAAAKNPVWSWTGTVYAAARIAVFK